MRPRDLRPLLALAALLAAPATASAELIDDFSYPTTASAAWRPVGEAPPPTPSDGGGLRFPVPFADGRDRVYWDRHGSWDFSRATGFTLTLRADHPEAMRSLTIYFRSGNGWYVWGGTLPAAGEQTLRIDKAACHVEGKPAGWSAIDRIRISPWKGRALDTHLVLRRFTAVRDRIFLVEAGATAPTDADRATSRRAVTRMTQWLRQAGIPHTVIAEDELATAARDASILILPHSPRLPDTALPALRDFTRRDGKIMGFFNGDPRLASLMEINLGTTTNTRDIAQWRGIAFGTNAPPGAPATVHQQSWELRRATPASTRSRVLALWQDAHGRISSEPAVIASPHGIWFTHHLLADDHLAKQRLLAGLLANLDPSLWSDLAAHTRSHAGRIDGWRDSAEAVAALTTAATGHPNEETLRAFLRRISREQARVDTYLAAGKARETVLAGHALTDLLIRAYALAQRPRPGEIRAVWDHSATGLYPGDWNRTAELLAASGINTLFINATWAGLAHYTSKHLPDSFTFRQYGDQLEQAVHAARAHGLAVHAWIICWNLENAPADFVTPLKKGDRLQRDRSGRQRLWMNPAHPANRRHHVEVIRELLARYDLDGIHLDYIRYPDSAACYSPYTRSRFEQAAGLTVTAWPADVLTGGKHHAAFVRWRAGTITDFVRETRVLMRDLQPTAKLSAAVWGGYPAVVTSIGQDWATWLEQDLVDFLCPMNYASDRNAFTALLDRQLTLPGARARLVPGIGIQANESQLRADQVIEQIIAVRERNLPGFALYQLGRTLADDTLPALRLGTTAPATP
jgi:uncharacterized lipoprotein YddW (UPF0748 family)